MKKFIGYGVINTKTEKFVDFIDCFESVYIESDEEWSTWEDKQEAKDLIKEIDYYISTFNDELSKTMKKNRKNLKIAEFYIVTKNV